MVYIKAHDYTLIIFAFEAGRDGRLYGKRKRAIYSVVFAHLGRFILLKDNDNGMKLVVHLGFRTI